MHGMPVACLCGHGPAELIEPRRHRPGASAATWIRQIGIRSVDPGEKRFVHEQGLEVFDMRYIDEHGHAPRHGAGAGHAGRQARTCT
jgi:arginase